MLSSRNPEKPFCCMICNTRFTRSDTLTRHITLKHDTSKPFKCNFKACTKEFALLNHLRRHEKMHEKHSLFSCTLCDETFSKKSKLRQHRVDKHGIAEFVCMTDGCHKLFASQIKLDSHQNSHNRNYMCADPDCLMIMTNYFDYRRHKAFAHKVPKTQVDRGKRRLFITELKSNAVSKINNSSSSNSSIDNHTDPHNAMNDDGDDDDEAVDEMFSELFSDNESDTDDDDDNYLLCRPVSSSSSSNIRSNTGSSSSSSTSKRQHVSDTQDNKVNNPEIGKPEVIFPCTFPGCSRSYLHSKNLKDHIKAVHTQHEARFTCPIEGCDQR